MVAVKPPSAPVTFSLRQRLMLAMGLLATIILVCGVAAPMAVGRLRQAVYQAVQVDGLMSQLASDVALKAQALRGHDQSYFLHIEQPSELYLYRTHWNHASVELGRAISAFTGAASSAEDKAQAREWAWAYARYIDAFRDVSTEVDQGKLTSSLAANERFDALQQNIESLVALSGDFATRKREAAQRSLALLDATMRQLNVGLIALSGLGMVTALVWCLYFPARMTRPLGALSAAAGRLAAGDLTVRTGLTRGDEIGRLGRAFDQMAVTIEQRTADLTAQYAAAEAARCEAEAARAKVAEQLATIAAQRSAIAEMSVPILPVARRVLVMPVVGALDTGRIAQAHERALRAVEASHAAFLLIDITGVPLVDTEVAQGLLAIVRSTALLGAQALLVGIRPEVAQTIVGLGIDLGAIVTRATLEEGVHYATGRGVREPGSPTSPQGRQRPSAQAS